jgi:hypothetical protein
VPNYDLLEFNVEEVKTKKRDKMRKDLAQAHDIAIEQHDLEYFKSVLIKFQEDMIERQQEKEAKAAAKASKKARKSQGAADDEDVDMADAADDDGDDDSAEKKSKKRKAEEDASVSFSDLLLLLHRSDRHTTDAIQTPQRSDSVKKPKIKVISSSTPKSANGTPSTKPAKTATEPKVSKPKPKKAEEKKEAVAPKEPELSAEENHARKGVSELLELVRPLTYM